MNGQGVFMTTEQPVDLPERVARLEARTEELGKRLDGMAKYLKELYEYLQKQQSQPVL